MDTLLREVTVLLFLLPFVQGSILIGRDLFPFCKEGQPMEVAEVVSLGKPMAENLELYLYIDNFSDMTYAIFYYLHLSIFLLGQERNTAVPLHQV